MAELKTQLNDGDVLDFLKSVENPTRRGDSLVVLELMKAVTGETPKMWGTSIVGFGASTMTYANGKTNQWMATGFSPRKQSMTLYIMDGFEGYDELMARLGKHSTGRSCLYIKKIEDIDQDVLRELVSKSVEHMRKTNPSG
jgi:hypothetical protein